PPEEEAVLDVDEGLDPNFLEDESEEESAEAEAEEPVAEEASVEEAVVEEVEPEEGIDAEEAEAEEAGAGAVTEETTETTEEPGEAPAAGDRLSGLSLAEAAAALEEGEEPFVEPAQSVLGATSGALSDPAVTEEVDRDSLQPSVFVDIGSDRAAD